MSCKKGDSIEEQREKYSKLIELHPFSEELKKIGPNKKGKVPPRGYFMEDYLRTMDPKTGMVYRDKIYRTSQKVARGEYAPSKNRRTPGSSTIPWVNRGPTDVGGRVRAIAYDPKDPNHKAVYAGGVSGGLWYNKDITDANQVWKNLSQFWANTSISCIAIDPNNSDIMYVGTGEIYTQDAQGSGIYRTMDGGATWQHIFNPPPSYNSTRNGIFYITDIKVRNNRGISEVYAGVGGAGASGVNHGFFQAGLFKSVDNGSNFLRLAAFDTGKDREGNDIHYTPNDIEISPVDNSIWVGTMGHSDAYSGTTKTGLKIFRSTDGTNFTSIFNGPSPTYYSRVQIGLSHQNADVAYVLYRSGALPYIQKTNNAGVSWQNVANMPNDLDNGIPANDFTRSQSWYDLVISVDPRNDATVYVGGIDLFKTTNSGTNWEQISKWSNNNNLISLQASFVHADQHAIVFNPNNLAEMLFGNDGGIFYIADNSDFSDSSPYISKTIARNNGFNVTQFYSARLKPNATVTNEYIVAGAQDNGTQGLYGSPNATRQYPSTVVSGGDGGQVLYDDGSGYFIHSYVRNYYYMKKGASMSFNMLQTSDRDYGHFINEITLDKNLNIAYSNRKKSGDLANDITLFRMSNLANATNLSDITTTVLTINNTRTEDATCLAVSPHTTNATKLFIGSNLGNLWRADNAHATPTYTQITTPFVGSVSSIKFGQSESEMLVTVSNFNVNNVWYTGDGGTTWSPKDGNLPDIPVRDAMFNPNDWDEVILATESGIWVTSNINSSSPTWSTSNNGLENVRVTQLDYRASDDRILAATYGRGVFTSSFNDPTDPCTVQPLIVTNPPSGPEMTTDVIISTLDRQGDMQDLMNKRAFLIMESGKLGLGINSLNNAQMNNLQAIPGMILWNEEANNGGGALMFYDGTGWKETTRCID